jgi:hypothetical protein
VVADFLDSLRPPALAKMPGRHVRREGAVVIAPQMAARWSVVD